MSETLLTIIIVTWNSEKDIGLCLQSIYSSTIATAAHVTVIDNNSNDTTRDIITRDFPQVKLNNSQQNLGFSKANNLALSVVKTPYAMLLNPDTIVTPTALEHMLSILKSHPEISLVGPRLILPSGRIQPESARAIPRLIDYFYLYSLLTMIGYVLFKGKIFCASYLGTSDLTHSRYVPALSGAAMMFPTEILKQIGLLDERFFFGGEDLDYCLRFCQVGKVYYDAEAIIHHNQGSSLRQSFGLATLETYFSDARLYQKYQTNGVWAFKLIVRITYLPRLIVLSLIEIIRGTFSLSIFWKALKGYSAILQWKSPITKQ